MAGYRLMVKVGKRWHVGKVEYREEAEAKKQMEKIVALGHDPKKIKVAPQSEIFE